LESVGHNSFYQIYRELAFSASSYHTQQQQTTLLCQVKCRGSICPYGCTDSQVGDRIAWKWVYDLPGVLLVIGAGAGFAKTALQVANLLKTGEET
jgi:hypothetical protein